MGYTHYWYRPPALDKATFAKAAIDCEGVLAEAAKWGIDLAGPDGTGAPFAEPAIVAFNGRGERAYETFAVPCISDGRERDGLVFGFCKTAHFSYDPVVVACLVVMKHHFGDDFRVSSDAVDTQELWEGLKLAAAAGIPGAWELTKDEGGEKSLQRVEVAA